MKRGITPVNTIYDEVIIEAPEDKGPEYLKLLEECMTTLEPWADGMPVKADGWYGKRYKKG
jgi:hypothetical protein